MEKRKHYLFLFLLLLTACTINLSAQGNYFIKLASPVTAGPSAGCAWIDYNKDGRLDAYLTYFNNSPYLYLSNEDGTFQAVSQADIIPHGSNFSGICWGDYTNDGNPDLYVTSMSGTNVLYRNSESGTFETSTKSGTTAAGGSFLSSNWIDYNNDGYLDLFVTNSGISFVPGTGFYNFIYKNNGDGSFVRDNSTGLENSRTTSAAFADIDNDGDMDLFMTEWGKDNWLYENNGNGSFTKISGTAVNTNTNISISASWGDYDNDGYMDLFVGNGFTSATVKQQNYLFHNNGDKTFTKVTTGAIAEYSGCVWTSAWGDVDNDGDLDLYAGTIYEDEELLYINNGDGTFESVHEFELNTSENGTSVTGASFGDYDNDGFLDLLVAEAGAGRAVVFRNKGNENNWISISCLGRISNPSAIGTRVSLKATISGEPVWQVREITGVQGFRGSNDLRLHFGLGDAAEIDSVIIQWPSGITTIQTGVAANQFHSVTEWIPNDYLRINFQGDVLSGYSPLTVQFSGSALYNESNPATSWSWDFNNDGIEDSDQEDPVYTYVSDEEKDISVRLIVSNSTTADTLTRENYIHVAPLFMQNIARGKTAASSSTRQPYSASRMLDGNTSSTYWRSDTASAQWVTIKLDSVYTIGRIVIRWGSGYARCFSLLSSEDSTSWFDNLTINDGNGGADEFFIAPVRAKYLKINMTECSGSSGYTIFEVEIYRPGLTGIEEDELNPSGFYLNQNYPNPFNPETVIEFSLGSPSQVVLKVYNILGREVATLVNEFKPAGVHRIRFDASGEKGLSSGVYFYSIKAGEFSQVKKMLLLQ